jgi:hypothetical protein
LVKIESSLPLRDSTEVANASNFVANTSRIGETKDVRPSVAFAICSKATETRRAEEDEGPPRCVKNS